MLMGRDQTAVLHSSLITKRCRILQLALATQKYETLLYFLLKYIFPSTEYQRGRRIFFLYFLPWGGLCSSVLLGRDI